VATPAEPMPVIDVDKLLKDEVISKDAKLYHKIADILYPYNSFCGISNDISCKTNKKPLMNLEDVLYSVVNHLEKMIRKKPIAYQSSASASTTRPSMKTCLRSSRFS
jgi:hypothetical protein